MLCKRSWRKHKINWIQLIDSKNKKILNWGKDYKQFEDDAMDIEQPAQRKGNFEYYERLANSIKDIGSDFKLNRIYNDLVLVNREIVLSVVNYLCRCTRRQLAQMEMDIGLPFNYFINKLRTGEAQLALGN